MVSACLIVAAARVLISAGPEASGPCFRRAVSSGEGACITHTHTQYCFPQPRQPAPCRVAFHVRPGRPARHQHNREHEFGARRRMMNDEGSMIDPVHYDCRQCEMRPPPLRQSWGAGLLAWEVASAYYSACLRNGLTVSSVLHLLPSPSSPSPSQCCHGPAWCSSGSSCLPRDATSLRISRMNPPPLMLSG